jgi:heat shock protein HslJ
MTFSLSAPLAVLLALLTTGCIAPTPAAAPASLDGTAWVLSTLAGTPIVTATAPTLSFAEGKAAGTDGCNRYVAPYLAQGNTITIDTARAASTRMACAPDAMSQSQAYLSALSAASTWRLHDGTLELRAADGTIRARFTAQPRALAGTAWRATAINDGKAAVTSLVAESSVTLTFGTDGQASGSAGCNRYTAAFEQQGDALRFKQAAATRRLCAAAGVMEQEAAYLAALQTVSTRRIEGDRLELRTATGALAAVFVRDLTAQ